MTNHNDKGGLILVCRSVKLDNFSWFENHLRDLMRHKYQERCTVVAVNNKQELIQHLFNPETPFAVAEVHVLLEFQHGLFRVDPADGDPIVEDDLQSPPPIALTKGIYLAEATIKMWYWSESDKPGFNLLAIFSKYFKVRFLFLPIAQLKLQRLRQSATSYNLHRQRQRQTGGTFSKITSSKINRAGGWVAVSVFFVFFFAILFKGFDRHPYDNVINYEDSSSSIVKATEGLVNKHGRVVTHTWLFNRIQWNFSWFIADQWLKDSRTDLVSITEDSRHELIALGYGNFRKHQVYSVFYWDTYWSLVFQGLIERNYDTLDNVVASLRIYRQKYKLDRYEFATFVLAFVQQIPYKIPETGWELFTPPETLNAGYGDCDSKALLYTLILKKLGYDVVIFQSNKHLHAMAGLNINASGSYKSYRGKRYYFVESTYPGYQIGQLVSRRGSPAEWVLVPL